MASRSAPFAWLVRTVLKLVAATLCILLLYQLWLFGWVLWYAWQPPASTAVMRAELARLQQQDPQRRLKYHWVDYGAINGNLKRAVVAAEDANFLEHGGVDWDAIEKAYAHNRQLAEAAERARLQGSRAPRRPIRGGSTITQQLAKNLFLSNSRSYARKAQEAVIAYMIETVMDKERILELYLNIAEWGEGLFGAEAASRHYFGVPARNLNRWQAARLAAMLPRPRYYERNPGSTYLASRTETLMRRMPAAGIP